MTSSITSDAISKLVEVDSLSIYAIVNDEIDNISPSPHPAVRHTHSLGGIPPTPLGDEDPRRGTGAAAEIRMDRICCGAHGLSLWITVGRRNKPEGGNGEEETAMTTHSLLFDTGPEGEVWERNVSRLGLDPAGIERVVLSHWHRDHSGGLVKAVEMIEGAKEKKKKNEEKEPVTVDLHPDRPSYRGVQVPDGPILSLEADPTLAEIREGGAKVELNDSAHTVLDDMFLVSGEIPRRTEYEGGLTGGVRFVEEEEEEGKNWVKDELLMDERLVMCNLRGKGLVVFTGCSHAGVVNVARHAVELGGAGRVPLYAVVGGFHLSNAKPEKMEASMRDLKALEPAILMPGHCTGWRFKYRIESEMPGQMVPVFGGTKYELLVE